MRRNGMTTAMMTKLMAGAIVVLVTGSGLVAQAAAGGSGTAQPMAGGVIYAPATMAPGQPMRMRMTIDAATMAMIHADMAMHDNKMAQQKTMMCTLRVLHQHRGMVELTCMPG